MKPLRPVKSLLLAGLLTGTVFSTAAAMTHPDMSIGGASIFFGCGAVFGMLMVSPIVVGEVFRITFARAFARYVFRFERYISLLMACALGYLFASMRNHNIDGPALIAMGIVFLCAMVKTFLFTVFDKDAAAT
jgi:hypothetical protein